MKNEEKFEEIKENKGECMNTTKQQTTNKKDMRQ